MSGTAELAAVIGQSREEQGADAGLTSAGTQRLKLTLDPRRVGEPDRRPEVSGKDSDGER